MDFQFSSEQKLIQDSTAAMTRRDIIPILKAHPANEPLPKAAMQRILEICAALGLTAPRIPEKDGGAGLPALTLGLMYEQLPPAVGFGVLSHEVTAARIHFDSTPEQRERFLPDLVAARRIACTATTEPAGGSDTRAIATRARRDGNDFILDGRKMWISSISIADLVNVTA
ncbi:MAG: acyl-CoA dehydrogenase family protein, partial [Hyphomicrobiaceae bacterium]